MGKRLLNIQGYKLLTMTSLVLVFVIAACLFGLASCDTPEQTQEPQPSETIYTGDWAEGQVFAYLDGLATSPDAVRYLADLHSAGYWESKFYENDVDKDFGGHKFSGWQVYFRLTSSLSIKEYWNDLDWAVFKDGYVTEGTDDALRVKADLMELNK